MFHMIYKIAVCLVLPLLCAFIEISFEHKHDAAYNLWDILCKWFAFWCLGIAPITVALMQMFNPSYTANLLSISLTDFIIIKELGYAQFAIGLLGLFSLKWKAYRQSAAIVYGVFILLAMLNHFMRLAVIDVDEIASTAADLWTVIVAAVIILRGFKKGESLDNN